MESCSEKKLVRISTIAIIEPAQEMGTSYELPGTLEDMWLDAEDTDQIDAALLTVQQKRRKPIQDWKMAFAGAVALHICLVAAAVEIFTHSHLSARWRVERGDPGAHASYPTPAGPDIDDVELIEGNSIPPPPIPKSTAHVQPSDSVPTDDSSELPKQIVPLSTAALDPVIGIGEDTPTHQSPHFASTQPNVAARFASSVAAPSIPQTAGRVPAAGVATPPRVASSGGGQRGDRDGFDSRGLPIPDYPAESRRRGEEGVVVVDVEVLPNGSVGTIHIVSDAGHFRLGSAAAEKLKLATFEPAREDGKPVVGHILIPYRFTLE